MKKLVFWSLLLFFGVAMQIEAAANELDYEIIPRAAFGRSADVEYLLKQGANPNMLNPADQNLVVIAAGRSDDEAAAIVKLLVDNGANFNLRDRYGDDAIIAAVKRGHPKTLQILFSYLPAMKRYDAENKSLEQLATERGDTEVIKLVKEAIDGENERLKAHKSDANFRRLVKIQAKNACTEAYLEFYLKLDDEKEFDENYYRNKIIESQAEQAKALTQLQRYFALPRYIYKDAAKKAHKTIIKHLLNYEKAFQRKIANVGSDADIEKRCTDIGTSMGQKLRRKTYQ